MQTIDIRLPARRVADLVTTETSSDLIIYDQNSSAIHTLNEVTASVWQALDGTTTLQMVSLKTGYSAEVVQIAVSQLADAGLLDGELATEIRSNQSRRALLKKAGIAASIPVLISVSAPLAGQAATVTCEPSCAGSLTFTLGGVIPNFACSDGCGNCTPIFSTIAFDFTAVPPTITISYVGTCTGPAAGLARSLAPSDPESTLRGAFFDAYGQTPEDYLASIDTGTEGDDTGTKGDDTGTKGDDTGTEGDDTGTEGDDIGTEGDDTGTEGDDTGTDEPES